MWLVLNEGKKKKARESRRSRRERKVTNEHKNDADTIAGRVSQRLANQLLAGRINLSGYAA